MTTMLEKILIVDEYTLTRPEIKAIAQLFLCIFFAAIMIFKSLTPEPKRLSWGISLVNSSVFAISGCYYFAKKLPFMFAELYQVYSQNGNQLSIPFIHSIDNFSVVLCLWFGLANLCDLFFGLIFYRKYLGILTAYIHHTLYIWIVILGCTGNVAWSCRR